MKIELTTKTFEIDGTEFVITKNKNEYAVVGGTKDKIMIDEDYTESELPEHYRRLFKLEKGEKLADNIVCIDVEFEVFDL